MGHAKNLACQGINPLQFTRIQAQKVMHHPCYSSSAHHRYARMHLAVAPACNIQCNYCNRKYDCSNESRPGVVSEVLLPQQAIEKARYVAAKIPQLSVIGIAGPGDPMANVARTFNTLEGLRNALPDIKLCLSTNGIMLPDHINSLVELGVDHVTVTLNTLEPAIANQIYASLWLYGEKYSGDEVGQVIIERQLEGITKLVEKNILVKINTVLIPGINDQHILAVSKKIKQLGVLLHNIVPLISRKEYGTYFGLNGQREPTTEELQDIRQQCRAEIPQMAHCKQCRADAIGMLGEDQSQSYPFDSIPHEQPAYLATLQHRTKIQAAIATQGESDDDSAYLVAVASNNGDIINLHFGHVDRFLIYSVLPDKAVFIGERYTPKYCQGRSECDEEQNEQALAGEKLNKLLELLTDIDAVLCVRIGMTVWHELEQRQVEPYVDGAWRPVEESLLKWRATVSRPAKGSMAKQQGIA